MPISKGTYKNIIIYEYNGILTIYVKMNEIGLYA